MESSMLHDPREDHIDFMHQALGDGRQHNVTTQAEHHVHDNLFGNGA